MPASPNPFDDPSAAPAVSEVAETPAAPDHSDDDAVLPVDRNATLTLGTEALVVLDEGLRDRRAAHNCCGLVPHGFGASKTTRAIPFSHVLWAEITAHDEVRVDFATPTGKATVRPAALTYALADKAALPRARAWVARLLDRAYPPRTTRRRKRILALVNPFGGQGHAGTLWAREAEPLLAAARCAVEVQRTAYRGHARELAASLDVDAWDVVACASGDGVPHEVFNGLARQARPRRALRAVAVVQIPCGSGNAMSLNLNGTDSVSLATLAIIKGVRAPLDLVAITQGPDTYYSFLSQAVGIVAESDLGTESLRWMGPLRFTWGFLVRLMGKTIYPAEVSIVLESDDKRAIKDAFRQVHRDAADAQETRPEVEREEQSSTTTEEEEDFALPPLQFGNARDPLPSTFLTTDLPALGNFYVGNMCWMSPSAPFFPTALPADGLLDMVTTSGQVSRITAIKMLAAVEAGTFIDLPDVSYQKVRAYRITPRRRPASSGRGRVLDRFTSWLAGSGHQKDGLISVDGEGVPFAPFQAEVLPGVATVLSRRGGVYEFELPE